MCSTHIITGDININILASDNDVDEYSNILCTFGFQSLINCSTRPSSGSCIDHFFIKTMRSLDETKVEGFVLQSLITDHYPIILVLDFESERKETINRLNVKKYVDFTRLKHDLNHETWLRVYEGSNANSIAESFIRILLFYINRNTRSVHESNKNSARKEWITSSLIKLINEKNELYKRLKNDSNRENLQKLYAEKKNELSKRIKIAKTEYLEKCLSKQSGSQGIWKFVREMCGANETNNEIPRIKTDDGKIIDNDQEIADLFNEYYSSLGGLYAQNIKMPDGYRDCDSHRGNSFHLYPTTPIEVEQAILQLKSKKAPGKDGIRTDVLKNISDVIAVPMSYLINFCFEKGSYPDAFKLGLVKPVYKSGDKLIMQNYRPISLISNLGKIFEIVLKNRVTDYLDKYHIISDRQYGFRSGRSTEDAIRELTRKLYNCLDDRIPSLCIFVDLAKAFDTVCHEKLLNKLYTYGFRGQIHELLRSYLTNRKQVVEVNGVQSHEESVTYGVPQGTVLGPVLFLIYMNGLFKINTQGDIFSFADDTVIQYSADSWDRLKEKAESDFINLKNWFQYNKLTMNIEKTKYLPFASYSSGLPELGDIEVDTETKIPQANEVRYLGVIVDRHLKWDKHIDHIVKKLRHLLCKFKFLTKIIKNKKYLKLIYDGLVHSQISYGIVGWGGLYDTHLHRLNVLQKYILKIIFEKRKTFPSEKIFEISGVLNIRQTYGLKILLNIFTNRIPLTQPTHEYPTRNREYSRPRCRKSIGQRSCHYLAPRVYGFLPAELKTVMSYNSFKTKTKSWIRENKTFCDFL